MGVSNEDLSKLLYDAYQSAAVNRGWRSATESNLSWAFVPEEDKAARRDAVAVIEKVIREDEQTKYNVETIQTDLKQIMTALGMNTHARSYSPHDMVQKEILPQIHRMKKSLIDVRNLLEKGLRLL